MHSPGQVSEYLGIAPSTLRHYARTFSAHLSQSAQGRRRQYTDQDLETLAQIKTLSNDGKTLDQIREILGEIVIVVPQEDQPTSSLAVIPVIIEQYETLDSKMDQVLERLDRIENKPSFWDRITGRKPE